MSNTRPPSELQSIAAASHGAIGGVRRYEWGSDRGAGVIERPTRRSPRLSAFTGILSAFAHPDLRSVCGLETSEGLLVGPADEEGAVPVHLV